MSFLKDHLPWIAPTGAVIASAAFLASTDVFDRAPAPVAQAFEASDSATLAPVVAPPAAAAPRTPVAAIDADQIVAALNRVRGLAEETDTDVTRNEPIALLDTATLAGAEPARQAVSTEGAAQATPSGDFFAAAQARLAADSSCVEDLEELTRNTRIYFPAGGLTAEEAGLIQARIIGQVARNCPGYSIRVEGHSDPSGSSALNLELSKKRAEAVISRLAAGGIDTSSFIAVGMGDRTPSTLTGPEGSAYYDRRVEFSVVEQARTASAAGFTPQPWAAAAPACATDLAAMVAQTRIFYAPRSVTVLPSELEAVYELAREVSRCDGARLRVVGHHADDLGSRESIDTGRLRALVLMGSLVSAGFESEQIIVAAPSYSVGVTGQPSLPNSRVDFQVITD